MMYYNNEIIKIKKEIGWKIPTNDYTIKKIIKSGDKIYLHIIPYFIYDSMELKDTPIWYQEWVKVKLDFYCLIFDADKMEMVVERTGIFI